MKKNIFALTALLLTFASMYSQTNVYHPFPISNAVWRVNTQDPCEHLGEDPACSYYQYTMGGDTTIGFYIYKKIYKSGMMSYCPNYLIHTYEYSYQGGLRQDTVNKKVYFKSLKSPDTLIYDFSKKVGDTLNIAFSTYIPPVRAIIDTIDSVLIGSNYHKQFHLNIFTNTIIEGIGATSGLLEPINYEPYYLWNLVCFTHNKDIYPSTSTSCPLITGTHELIPSDNQIKIIPNPVNDLSVIRYQLTSRTSVNIRVYDFTGRAISTLINTIQDKGTYKIPLCPNYYKAGIYFIKIETNNNINLTKLIKQ